MAGQYHGRHPGFEGNEVGRLGISQFDSRARIKRKVERSREKIAS